MAKKKASKRASKRSTKRSTKAGGSRNSTRSNGDDAFLLEPGAGAGAFAAETTGRSIVTVMDDSADMMKQTLSSLKKNAGISDVCHMSDFDAESFEVEQAEEAEAIVLDELNIAIVAGDSDQASTMATMASDNDSGIIVEPDYMNYAFTGLELPDVGFDGDVLDDFDGGMTGGPAEDLQGRSADFLRGYQQGVNRLVDSLVPEAVAVSGGEEFVAAASFADNPRGTWGLHATRVLRSQFDGTGIRVAVLDTGLDLHHPDFVGRTIRSRSFIPGEAVQDRNGHGTHCIGTSCGSRDPGVGPRYGIAHRAEIFAGKVLSNGGSGSDAGILSGINWAVGNRCQVVSMSLGRGVRPGERPTRNYEVAGRRALSAGTLIVAAAGNDSSRPMIVRPVSSPANAQSIVAVAAIDRHLRVASFSNRGVNPGGGEINISGPGVDVLSSWFMPRRLRSISGTSMATPHVAGVAALLAQENPSARGVPLYRELRRRARRLSHPFADVGNGLVQAT